MKLDLVQLLVLGLASTATASTWFGKAGEKLLKIYVEPLQLTDFNSIQQMA